MLNNNYDDEKIKLAIKNDSKADSKIYEFLESKKLKHLYIAVRSALYDFNDIDNKHKKEITSYLK